MTEPVINTTPLLDVLTKALAEFQITANDAHAAEIGRLREQHDADLDEAARQAEEDAEKRADERITAIKDKVGDERRYAVGMRWPARAEAFSEVLTWIKDLEAEGR